MSTNTSQSSYKRRSSLQIQAAAVRALFLRELQTRFGRYRLGYLWALIEPAIHVGFMLLLFSGIISRAVPGISYPVFLVCGILPWFMFTRTATRAIGAVSANKGLFNYRPVRPIDAVIARAGLEGVIYFNVYVVMLGILAWSGENIGLQHIPLVLLVWVTLWLFSFAFAILMMILGHFSEELSKFISVFFRILYLASGVLYSIHAIPEPYQSYMLWNPVLHGLEQIRHAISPSYPIHHISYSYLLLCTIVMLFLGLLLYKNRERRMMTS